MLNNFYEKLGKMTTESEPEYVETYRDLLHRYFPSIFSQGLSRQQHEDNIRNNRITRGKEVVTKATKTIVITAATTAVMSSTMRNQSLENAAPINTNGNYTFK